MKNDSAGNCPYLNLESKLLICYGNYGSVKLRGENKSLCNGMEIYKDELKTNLENIKSCSYRVK